MSQQEIPENPFWRPVRQLLKHIAQGACGLLSLYTKRSSGHEASVGHVVEDSGKSLAEPLVVKDSLMVGRLKMSPKKWMIAGGLVLFVFLALIGWRLFHTPENPYLKGANMAGFDPRPTVETDVVETHTLTRKIKTIGSLKATDSAVMKSEVPGVVHEIYFKDGMLVKKGQPLLKLDDAMQKAIYDAKVTEYKLAKADNARSEELFKLNIQPEQAKEKAFAQMQVAFNNMKMEEVRLSQYTITAPFDGIVGLRDLSVGSYVQQAQELITVVNLNPMKVDFKVPEFYLKNLSEGQTATVQIDGFEGSEFTAKIDAIDPKVDPTGHSVQIRASIDNVDTKLRPGMFANIILTIGEESDALMIPEAAIDRSGDDEFVYVIRDIRGDKVAIRTIVVTGLREDGRVEIRDGLSAGNEVVVAGHVKIRDGYQVRVVDRALPSGAHGEEASSDGLPLGGFPLGATSLGHSLPLSTEPSGEDGAAPSSAAKP